MNLLRALLLLRAPLATLALCALLSQQLVGLVLTASPAKASEAGFSLCLSGALPAEDGSGMVGAGFCPCTLHAGMALLPAPCPSLAAPMPSVAAAYGLARQALDCGRIPTGPPPARAPPITLHS